MTLYKSSVNLLTEPGPSAGFLRFWSLRMQMFAPSGGDSFTGVSGVTYTAANNVTSIEVGNGDVRQALQRNWSPAPAGTSSLVRFPYLGFVATRGHAPTTYNAGAKNSMSRSRHIAMDNISQIQLAFAGYSVGALGEGAVGANLTYTASIEFPVGVAVTRITFGSQSSGVCAPGTTLFSDMVNLPTPIPRGESFYVRMFITTTGGIPFSQAVGLNTPTGAVPASGEWWVLSSGAVTDNTGSLTNQNNGIAANAGMQVPLAILGYTNRHSMLIVGDSRTIGPQAQENVCNTVGDTGNIARSVGRQFAYCGVGAGGEQLAGAVGSQFSQRTLMAAYCSHIVCAYGINDFQTGGLSAATTLTNLASFAAKFNPTKPIIVCTVEPNTNSTDGWGTVANQSQVSGSANTQRVLYNDALRRGSYLTPIVRTADIANAVESAPNSGTWLPAERSAADCSITSGQAILTSTALAQFTPDDVGKYVSVVGAGPAGAALVASVITYTSATSVTLSANASTTVGPTATAYIGTPTSDGIHGSSISSARIERSTAFSVLAGL